MLGSRYFFRNKLNEATPSCLLVATCPPRTSCESVRVQTEHRRGCHMDGAEHDRSLVSQTLVLFICFLHGR